MIKDSFLIVNEQTLNDHGFTNFAFREQNFSVPDSVKKTISCNIAGNTDLLKPGLYLWVIHLNGKTYQLYLGSASERRTGGRYKKGVAGRIFDYFNDFQASCPNDFKIQLFHKFAIDNDLDLTYSVYYSSYDKKFPGVFSEKTLREWETKTRVHINCIFQNNALFNEGNRGIIENAYYTIYKNNHFANVLSKTSFDN
jgi:hypothetical protein